MAMDDQRKTKQQLIDELADLRRQISELEASGIGADREQLLTEALKAQKMESLGLLAAGIANDFNNHLIGILLHTELALQELPPASPVGERLREIETAAQRAAELSEQMLAYSGMRKVAIEPFDLSGLVDEMRRLLTASVARDTTLKYNLGLSLPPVKAYAAEVRQIVMNLVVNAAEAVGREAGVISISTGTMECGREFLAETFPSGNLRTGPYVYLEVADDGIGMDEPTQAKIFDPFFTTKSQSKGLGLAAVSGIVRSYYGGVRVQSAPGGGTTISVFLPAAEDAETKLAAPLAAGWHGGTALVVDDEETVRTAVRNALEKFGFQVLTADDGRQGIEAFRAHADEIAVVLLAIKLPQQSAEEVFAEIRGMRSDVPVILSSGWGEQAVTEPFAGQDRVGFLKKPYRLVSLREKLRELLGG